MQYVDHWSPWLDLKILAKTMPAVLKGWSSVKPCMSLRISSRANCGVDKTDGSYSRCAVVAVAWKS
jgi:hypothetical protein